MKAKLQMLVLPVLVMIFCLPAASPAQITFVKTAERSGGSAGQQTPRKQEGLSPEKKKSLSKFGPEDAFPGAREEDEKQTETKRSTTRKPSASPTPTPAIVSSTPQISTSMPVVISTPPTPQTKTNPAMAAATKPDEPQSPSGRSWGIPVTLSTAALLVFGALIYVVGMLRKKLYEGDR